MKFAPTFATFSAAVTEAGYLPQPYSDNIFYVKPSTKGTGKVELNVKSGTFIVGSGSKHLEAITAEVNLRYTLIKRAKGWSIFQIGGMGTKGQDEILADFNRLVEAVSSAVPAATVKMSTVVKKASEAYRVKATTKADLAAIRAKNLATAEKAIKREKDETAMDYPVKESANGEVM